MDFIEFFQNEQKYGREITFDGQGFKVKGEKGYKFTFYDKKFIKDKSDRPENENRFTNYCIIEMPAENGKIQRYILKDDYFTGYYLEIENEVVQFKSKEISENEVGTINSKLINAKKHRKRKGIIIVAILALLLMFSLVLCFFQCRRLNSNGNGDSFFSCNTISRKENGTYYLQRPYASELDKNYYIKLENGKFTDKEGTVTITGTYEISNNTITFYAGDGNNKQPLMSGTIKDGVITLLSAKFVKENG